MTGDHLFFLVLKTTAQFQMLLGRKSSYGI